MGNTHTVNNGKKTIGKDEVINGNGSVPVAKESTNAHPAQATGPPIGSVAELTDLQKRLLQDSW